MIIRFLDPDVATWLRPRETPPRSSGRHVSTIVLEMLKRISRRYELYEKRPDGPQAVYEPGYLWEDALSQALAGRAATAPQEILLAPVELTRDAVYGTPDRLLFDMDARRWIVEESKCTWMSSRGLDDNPMALFDNLKFSYWFAQVKTYAAMMADFAFRRRAGGTFVGGGPCAVASHAHRYHDDIAPTAPALIRIRSLHLNGPYGWSKDFPKPLAWEIEHTAEELAAHWASVLRFEALRGEPTDVRPDAAADPTRN